VQSYHPDAHRTPKPHLQERKAKRTIFTGELCSTPTLCLFALAVLPVLFFLGATTCIRLVQNSLLSAAYVIGVDRIRELYRQIAPSGRCLFPQLSPDNWPVEGGSGLQFFTHATQAAILTSLIGGVLVAVSSQWGVLVLVAVYLFGDQRRQWQRNRRLRSTLGHQ
jgi:hypothetical protein